MLFCHIPFAIVNWLIFIHSDIIDSMSSKNLMIELETECDCICSHAAVQIVLNMTPQLRTR